MILHLLPSILLLGSATAKSPAVFGRSMHTRPSPLKSIRSAGIDAAKAAKKEVVSESLSPKTPEPLKKSAPSTNTIDEISRRSPKATKPPKKSVPSADTIDEISRRSPKATKTTRLFKKRAFSDGSSDLESSRLSPKASKKSAPSPKASKKFLSSEVSSSESLSERSRRWPKSSKQYASMSFDFMSFDVESSLSFEFSMPFIIERPSSDVPFVIERPTTVAPPTTVAVDPESADSSSGDSYTGPAYNLGHIIFDFLSQCANLPLDIDSCLVSNTIDVFMESPDESMNGRRRLLQASNGKVSLNRLLEDSDEGEEECGRPEDVDREYVRAIMSVTKEQCNDAGIDIPDGEFNDVLNTFMRLFANNRCWEALCDEVVMSELFYKIIFDDAAKCANGETLAVHECVKDQLVDYIMSAPETDECDTPSESDFRIFTSFMLTEAEGECEELGVDLEDTDWGKVSSDLVNMFASMQCWGMGDCEEIDYSLTTEPPVYDEDSIFVITDDGHRCIFEMSSDPESEQWIEVPFFYQVETDSSDGPSLEYLEELLIQLACNDSRRSRILIEQFHEPVVVAVDSSPDDIISTDYNCTAENPDATHCHIVEGKVTVIVESESTEISEEVLLGSYEELERLFDALRNDLDDPNIVDVVYIGKEMRSVTPATKDTLSSTPTNKDAPPTITTKNVPEDEPTVDTLKTEVLGDDSEAYKALLIAASGAAVAMAMLVGGFHRMNKEKEETEESTQLDEKSHDGSNDGQSTAYGTADLTAASCDRSDVSSLPSPARSMGLPSPAGSLSGAPSPTSHRGTEAARFFVLAEEEEENWRELSILPDMCQDDGTLEGVSEEEGSFVSATSSDDNGEMSV